MHNRRSRATARVTRSALALLRGSARVLVLLLGSGLLLTACGGSPKSKVPVPQQIITGAIPAFTGSLLELTPGVTYIPSMNTGMSAGDDVANNHLKGFIRIDLSGVPAGATVQNAVLTITQIAPIGTPYANLLTNLTVDHVDAGAAVDAADFIGNTLSLNFGTISSDPVLETKTINVGPQIALDLAAGRTTSDFRFTFPSPTDNAGDVDTAHFVAAGFAGEPTVVLDLLVLP